MTEVCVIGCGPAGLLAAHACALLGYEPVILSRDAKPSPLPPAVFVHAAIPDVSSPDPDGRVMFTKVGTSHGYAEKVYGDPEHPTSWEKFDDGSVPAWAFSPIYAELWRRYGSGVRACEVTPSVAGELVAEYPLVINSAPLHYLCPAGHAFPGRTIWIKDYAPRWVQRDMMVYNGVPDYGWYRASDFFGVRSTEYGSHPGGDARRGLKVQPTDCDCHPGITRIGRWGSWTPGVLLHHAFERAQRAIDGYHFCRTGT